MTEDRQYPCQRLNPNETCPELKYAWAQVLDLTDRLSRLEKTKLSKALGFIASQGLETEFKEYMKQ